jgi:Asp-tRNA(Asn)/Glu-tRNA(Gln) amidotransferase A subunit family amidase
MAMALADRWQYCNPAGKASIVGLKATAELISRDGTMPNSYRLDALDI